MRESMYGSGGVPLTPGALCLTCIKSGWFSQPDVTGTPLPSTSTPSWRAQCRTGTSPASRVTSAAKMFLPDS